MEGWPSGWRRRFAKPLYGQKPYRGFESLFLRHPWWLHWPLLSAVFKITVPAISQISVDGFDFLDFKGSISRFFVFLGAILPFERLAPLHQSIYSNTP
jgi:hypothetical protein